MRSTGRLVSGASLSISYISPLLAPPKERKALLEASHQFQCSCQRCQAETEEVGEIEEEEEEGRDTRSVDELIEVVLQNPTSFSGQLAVVNASLTLSSRTPPLEDDIHILSKLAIFHQSLSLIPNPHPIHISSFFSFDILFIILSL